MAIPIRYGCSWFDDCKPSTGASISGNRTVIDLAAIAMLVISGTGAFVDDLQRWRQNHLNDPIANPIRVPIIVAAAIRTPSEDLDHIRGVLDPAMSDLATVLNVSRQAIYNWINGEKPDPKHIAKLRDLALAADIFSDMGIPITGTLLKRKIVDDKNLLELARAGHSAQDAAQLFAQVIRKETQQRAMMATRFAHRKAPLRSAESDFPSENDRS